MIDRALAPASFDPGVLSGLQVLTPEEEKGTVVPMEDGGVEIRYGSVVDSAIADAPFSANLAEVLPLHALQVIASDLRTAVDDDLNSRKEWETALTAGLDLLGIKSEERTIPWSGACGIVHPMILEAAVRFQSKSITKLFPPKGPADAKVIGESSQAKLAQAKRVAEDLNHWIMEKMPEYREETEQLLFSLPVDGSAFRKIYFDPLRNRPVAEFVAANDFVLPYGFPNLETAPRYTHIMRQSFADVMRLMQRGFYREVPLSETPVELDKINLRLSRLAGMSPSYSTNELLTVREIHCDLQIDELGDGDEPLPYVVTIEQSSNEVLALRRNWREADRERRKVQYFAHYRYVPWKGAYGLGLIHLIGGIGKGCTSILRQLVDAGTLSNLPGGLKTRGMRVKGDSDPIMPGEWRDVDIPTGKIADCIFPMPYKEPSAVLLNLLTMLISEGKSFASIAELEINASSQNAPVGTMLALIERATEVITAVQSRLHSTLGRELTYLAEIIRDCTPPVYEYEPVNAPRSAKKDDYDQQVSIVPVSDPASATMAQKVMEYQAALQLSASAPQLYNLPLLHRSMLEVLGIDNAEQIVPDKTDVDPMDPVSENMALITSKPVRAFEWQDHGSHLQCHQSFLQDPKIQQGLQQSPLAASVMSAAQSHIAEHMAYQYRRDIEKQIGVPLPAHESKLPPEIEEQLSAVQAQAAQKLLQQDQQEAQAKQAQQQQQDPLIQMQQQELQIKGQSAQAKAMNDQQKIQLEQAKLAQKATSDQQKLASAERRTAAQVQAEQTIALLRSQNEQSGLVSGERKALLQHEREQGKTVLQHQRESAKMMQDRERAEQDRLLKLQTQQPPAPAPEPPLQ